VRVFPPEVEVGPDEGFTPEKDIFGRKEFGDRLTNLVSAIEGPAVLVLDAPWGTGKTTFVKMWRGALRQRGIASIYFDAFANDFHNDSFLAIAGEILARAESEKPAESRALADFKDGALRVGKVLGRAVFKAGVQIGTAGLVSAELVGKSIDEVSKIISEGATDAADALLKEQLENHNTDKKIFDDFRKSLEQLISAPPKSSDAAKPTKLVFIIDELDRCRPPFALEILEKIKHFFSVPNLIFVLVTNVGQLEAAIHFAYGPNIDAQTYLQKFYHLRLMFKGGTPRRLDLGSERYLRHLFQKISDGSKHGKFVGDIVAILSELAERKKFSLRTLERIAAYITLVFASATPNQVIEPSLLGVLSLLKVTNSQLYAAAREGRLSFDALDQYIDFGEWIRSTSNKSGPTQAEIATQCWQYIFADNYGQPPEQIKYLRNALSAVGIASPGAAITNLCDLIDGFEFPGDSDLTVEIR
jgi:hypothetical protein